MTISLPNELNLVAPYLYVTNLETIDVHVASIKKLQVANIINVADGRDTAQDSTIHLYLPHTQYNWFPIPDEATENIVKHALTFVIPIIKRNVEAQVPTILHCYQGKSRSIACALVWIIQSQNIPIDQALKRIKLSRPIAQPNRGFMDQLYNYSKELMGRKRVFIAKRIS